MNRNEYMAALRRALSVLPEEERANALRYYEEYFDDAGPENEQQAIAGLGDPQAVAAQILADYRELTAVPPRSDAPHAEAPHDTPQAPKRGWRGINPWLLLALVVLAVPVGIPLVLTLGGVLLALLAAALCVVIAALIVIVAVPLCLCVGGIALIVFSCMLWLHPASALVTLGTGLACLAAGVLLGLLMIKLCTLFVPPVFRGFVAILRWPVDKLRKRGAAK